MFTGIIREIGVVKKAEPLPTDGRRLTFVAPQCVPELIRGASIAVDGACLTVVALDGDCFTVEVVRATLDRTIAGSYEVGSPVNLEPAITAGSALDGHIVQGHVDGVGELTDRSGDGGDLLLRFQIPSSVGEISIPQGSITINGVSLTLESLPSAEECRIAVIPHTARETTLGTLTPGARVNLEGDLIGKHVGRYLARRFGSVDPAT